MNALSLEPEAANQGVTATPSADYIHPTGSVEPDQPPRYEKKQRRNFIDTRSTDTTGHPLAPVISTQQSNPSDSQLERVVACAELDVNHLPVVRRGKIEIRETGERKHPRRAGRGQAAG